MTTFAFANNVNTTLADALTATATTLTLSSADNLPASIPAGAYMALTLNDAATHLVYEIVYVTAISGATLTVIRAQEGTAAVAWLAGDSAFSGPTAGQMATLQGWQGLPSGVTSFNNRSGVVDPATGDYSWSQIGGTFPYVTSVNGDTGAVTIPEGVTSFDGETGAVTLTGAQVSSALGYTAANDAAVVHIAGTETISGAKTFIATLAGATGTFSVALTGATVNATNIAGGTGLQSNGTDIAGLFIPAGKKFGLGITGEVWHDVHASRALGSTYTNTHDYPIMVVITTWDGQTSWGFLNYLVNGIVIGENGTADWSGFANASYSHAFRSFSFIVQPGLAYGTTVEGEPPTMSEWYELY